MKRFITFTLCLLLCVVTLGLSGCGNKDKGKVDTSVATHGNGGMVVSRGDYVYFVNGYTSYTTFTKSNLSSSFDIGGLYRAKLNDNGGFEYDENGSLIGAEKLSSKLVGFESTSLYVFGNHIYYATPITEVDKQGGLQTSKLEFRRSSITGGKADVIYQSKAEASNTDFEFYYADGRVYLMINENGTLKRVNGFGKFNVSKVDTNVKTLVLPRDTDDVFSSDSYKNIFYTKANEDGKIEIYNYNVASNKAEYKQTTEYKTLELQEYKFGHLYFKASENSYPSYTYYYRVDATENAIRSMSVEKLTSDKDYTALYLLDNETDGYIAQSSDKTYYLTYRQGGESTPVPIADTKIDIMTIKNGYIYLKSSNDIKRINIYNLKNNGDRTQETVLTIEGLQSYSYDIDDHNLYVYANKGDHTYLYSINVSNIVEDESFEHTLLGVYNNSDIEAE